MQATVLGSIGNTKEARGHPHIQGKAEQYVQPNPPLHFPPPHHMPKQLSLLSSLFQAMLWPFSWLPRFKNRCHISVFSIPHPKTAIQLPRSNNCATTVSIKCTSSRHSSISSFYHIPSSSFSTLKNVQPLFSTFSHCSPTQSLNFNPAPLLSIPSRAPFLIKPRHFCWQSPILLGHSPLWLKSAHTSNSQGILAAGNLSWPHQPTMISYFWTLQHITTFMFLGQDCKDLKDKGSAFLSPQTSNFKPFPAHRASNQYNYC